MSNILLTQDTGRIIGPVAKLLGYIMEGIFYVIDSIDIRNTDTIYYVENALHNIAQQFCHGSNDSSRILGQ